MTKKSKYRFCCCTVTFGSYFFPVNCYFKSGFALSWADKFTSLHVGSSHAIGLSITKNLLNQVRMKLISQLINGIARVLQKTSQTLQ